MTNIAGAQNAGQNTAQLDPAKLPDKDSPEMAWWRDSMTTRDQRLQWWREARFGMFIHWGVYSLGLNTPPLCGGLRA